MPDNLILDLPDFPESASTPPKYTAYEMLKRSEAMLPYWNKKRFIDKTLIVPPDWTEPFELID